MKNILAICAVVGCFSAILAGQAAEQQARQLAEKVLSGREAIVRVYNNWQAEPKAFELVGVKLTGLSISLDAVKDAFGELDESAVIVVTAGDQRDEAVAAVIGNFIHAGFYEPAGRLSIWPPSFAEQPDKHLSITDALGQPISGAKVEIRLNWPVTSSTKPAVSGLWLSDTTTDERGRIKPIGVATDRWRVELLVSHPDYGRAFAAPFPSYDQPTEYYVAPLLRISPETLMRSLWGTVLDAEGNAISGAIVLCWGVTAPGNVGKAVFPRGGHRTPTDEQGRFSFIVPIGQGQLAPLNSKYNIAIILPNSLDGEHPHRRLPCGRECTIVMGEPRYFHSFAFEDADGPITDANLLSKIRIEIERADKRRSYLGYDRWKDGGMFPLGTYRAAAWGKEPLIFKPIEVTADSPEQLVFKPPEGTIYYGQVVDGVAGQLIAGAIVMHGRFWPQTEDFSAITAQQWQAIDALPAYPSLDEPALEPLKKFCKAKMVARTDADGRFVITTVPGEELSDIVVAQEGYLPYIYSRRRPPGRLSAYSFEQNGLAKLPPFKLFPAATVLLEPYVEDVNVADEWLWVHARWLIDKENNPPWAGEIESAWYWYNRKFEPNKYQSMHVPAGLNLSIRLLLIGRPIGDVRGVLHWQPIFLRNASGLAQGQTVDVGRLRFESVKATFPIYLKLIDTKGQPIEGVGVWYFRDGQQYGINRITDEQGIAEFNLPLHSKGEFRVGYFEDGKVKLQQTTPCEVGGEQDIGRQFILQLSDEMLEHLFK